MGENEGIPVDFETTLSLKEGIDEGLLVGLTRGDNEGAEGTRVGLELGGMEIFLLGL